MDRKENLFLAKKIFTELVFNTAYIEGVNVTFPQTQAILDGAVVNNVPVSDIQTVLNLRDAWRYCLSTLDDPLDLKYICRINDMVSKNESLEWGKLRNGFVGVGGTEYIPPVPEEAQVVAALEQINAIPDAKERALEYFCYAVRSQLFWDGNKRTSTIVASKILIEAGEGVLTIGKAEALDFNEALLHYYDTADPTALKACLRTCIKTLSRAQRITDKLSAARDEAEQNNLRRSTTPCFIVKANSKQDR